MISLKIVNSVISVQLISWCTFCAYTLPVQPSSPVFLLQLKDEFNTTSEVVQNIQQLSAAVLKVN